MRLSYYLILTTYYSQKMESKVHRKKTRKLLYQQLFANTFWNLDEEEFYNSFFDDTFTFDRDEKYLGEMKKIIKEKEWFFVYVIEKYSPKFDFEKMSILNILPIYISLAEIFFLDEEIPIKASVNEAIELAKTYSDDSSKKIVNWVLNKVMLDFEELEKEKENFSLEFKSVFK